MTLIAWLTPPVLLLLADAAGMIDLSTNPLGRAVKWASAAIVAWFLPFLVQKLFHLQIDESHLNLWKLLILGVLALSALLAIVKLLWRNLGPLPEGHRRCPHCRKPVLKVMLECPVCRKSLT